MLGGGRKTLLCLLGTLAAALVLGVGATQMRAPKSDAIVPLRSHSIYAPYVDSNLQNKFWDFGGDAIVDTNRHIRLTQDRKSQMGWLWSRLTLSPTNYEINVEFTISGHSNSLYGDGMAMWLTTERAKPGPVFGSKDYWHGLGIFFDTYPNSRHSYTFPRVMAIYNDGTLSYDVGKDGAKDELAGCSVEIRKAKVATRAKLTYIKGVSLELSLHFKEWDQWQSCFTLDNVTIPPNPFIGFSAITGDVSDNHDLVAVSTSNIVYKPKTAEQLRRERDEMLAAEKSGSGSGIGFGGFFGFLGWVFKWTLIVAVILAAVAFARTYQMKRNAKRF